MSGCPRMTARAGRDDAVLLERRLDVSGEAEAVRADLAERTERFDRLDPVLLKLTQPSRTKALRHTIDQARVGEFRKPHRRRPVARVRDVLSERLREDAL